METGYFIYLIGISGSGKTTIADALEAELRKKDTGRIQVIDGDTIRGQFKNMFGYTYEERMKCNQAVRVVVQYLIQNGVDVILTQVAPYEEMRRLMREQFGNRYIQVYVKCPLEICMQRDVKGYYKKAHNGKMENLNGINDVYEIPAHSHVEVDTSKEEVQECVKKILRYLEENNYVV